MEFHFITHVANVHQIVEGGILSHRRSQHVHHVSVADPQVHQVQERRSAKVVMRRPLHGYANVYFDARNPMMVRKRGEYDEIAVMAVHASALDLPGAVIADGNAAADGTQFFESPGGLEHLDERYVYARYWVDPYGFPIPERKRKRCAELLVPELIPAGLVRGIYVVKSDHVLTKDPSLGIPVEAKPDLFL